MTLSTAPSRHLSTEPPQNKEEAVFMFEVGEECQRRALRFLVEVEGMSYGEIVKLAQQHNPNTKVTKNALKYLSSKMKADGEVLKTTKQPERLKASNKARKRVVEISTTPVENSEPAIEQVQVVVKSQPQPQPQNQNQRRVSQTREVQQLFNGLTIPVLKAGMELCTVWLNRSTKEKSSTVAAGFAWLSSLQSSSWRLKSRCVLQVITTQKRLEHCLRLT